MDEEKEKVETCALGGCKRPRAAKPARGPQSAYCGKRHSRMGRKRKYMSKLSRDPYRVERRRHIDLLRATIAMYESWVAGGVPVHTPRANPDHAPSGACPICLRWEPEGDPPARRPVDHSEPGPLAEKEAQDLETMKQRLTMLEGEEAAPPPVSVWTCRYCGAPEKVEGYVGSEAICGSRECIKALDEAVARRFAAEQAQWRAAEEKRAQERAAFLAEHPEDRMPWE